jgi:hypothetical protein
VQTVPWWEESKMEERRRRRRDEAPLHLEPKATKMKTLSLSHFLYEREDGGARWLLLQIQLVSSITTFGKLT